MNRRALKLVLLPGMDGTGELFSDFVAALPDVFEIAVVRYPTDVCLSFAELADFVASQAPLTKPFVLLAESFSTPLAIQYASTSPPSLKGLILCAGFASNPTRGLIRFVYSSLAPILFRVTMPSVVFRLFLVGSNAPTALLAAVRAAISSVKPTVLSARLRAVLACDARTELAKIDVPVLYIQAKQDRLVRASCVKEILRIRPETEVEAVDGPHLILQRQSQRTAEAVATFIQQLI